MYYWLNVNSGVLYGSVVFCCKAHIIRPVLEILRRNVTTAANMFVHILFFTLKNMIACHREECCWFVVSQKLILSASFISMLYF